MLPPQIHAATGHADIDRQHGELAKLVSSLEKLCTETPAGDCSQCEEGRRLLCRDRLADLLGELLAFMVEHFRFEELLMRSLPPTEVCRQHVERHKAAHTEVSRHLAELAFDIDELNPQESARRLHTIINHWLGCHNEQLDTPLARQLETDYQAELEFDVELAELLGEG